MENITAFWQNNIKNLFKKKSIEEINLESLKDNRLKKSLSLLQVISFGIGVIVGSGIFVLTGIASGLHAGPAITISFAISGFICICAGFCYAEFSSMLNTSGSSYSYTYITFGRLPAWIVGSIASIGYFLGAVSVVVGWSRYFNDVLTMFNLEIPKKFALTTGTQYMSEGNIHQALFDLPAFTISSIATIILYKSTILSSIITSLSVFTKLFVLLCFCVIGLFYIDINNWTPYIPINTGNFGEYGISGIISGISIVFLAFNGFDSICTAAQEVKNPQKNIPLGIMITIIIVTIIYIIISAVMTGLVSYTKLGVPHGLAVAVDKIGLPYFNYVIKFGALTGLSSVIIVSQYTVIRMLMVMAKDKLLPKILTKIHGQNKTPHIITLIIGVAMSFISATITLENIVRLSSFFILSTLIIVCTSSIINRYTNPKLNLPFRCPFMPITPAVAITLSLYILFSYPLQVFINAGLVVGILIIMFFVQRVCSQIF